MTLKNGPDEEWKRSMAVTREQTEKMQSTGPVETLQRTQLEEQITKKGNAVSKVPGQQNEHNQNNVEKSKTIEGKENVRRKNNKEGENKNMGVGTTWTNGPGQFKYLFLKHMLINVNCKFFSFRSVVFLAMS